MQERQPVTLPLETLFERLELAGFDCSPAQRMRAVRLLAALGTAVPGKERLRGLLAPIVVHSAEEQKRFYEIFDRYWEEMQAVEEVLPDSGGEKKPPVKWRWKKIAAWLAAILIVTAALEYSGWQYRGPQKPALPEPAFEFKMPPRGYYETGDTIYCINTTEANKDDSLHYAWRIQDVQGNIIQQGPKDTPIWSFVDTPPENGPLWFVGLAYGDSSNGVVIPRSLTVYCKNRPAFPRFNIPANIKPGQSFRMGLAEKPRPHHVYSWNCFDTVFYASEFTYTFQSGGINNVLFAVKDTSQAGACSRDTMIPVQVGQTRVSLPLKNLEYDSVEPVARFRWPFWALLGVFALVSFWFWWQWGIGKLWERVALFAVGIDRKKHLNLPNNSTRKNVFVGTVLYIIAALACVSSYQLYISLIDNYWQAGIASIIYGVFIFIFIRSIILSTHSRTSKWGLVPRLVLAVFLSLIISQPILITIFQDTIYRYEEIHFKAEIYEKYERYRFNLQREIDNCKTKVDSIEAQYRAEIIGKRPGLGNIARSLEQDLLKEQNLCNQITQRNQPLIDSSIIAQSIENKQNHSSKSTLWSQITALNQIMDDEVVVFWAVWLTRLLILILLISPVVLNYINIFKGQDQVKKSKTDFPGNSKNAQKSDKPETKLPPGWAQATDRPPYYIPFREQKGVLKTAREQLRFGDALRLRQEGEDAVLDIPATLRQTVDGGGYPRFRYRFRTRPSEYLFLIDEQMPGKHLSRLFRHLAENLRGQDVLLEILWYDRDFHRFWGPALPKGVPLDQLHRLFPHHRLVLLGDAHGLLDTYSDTTPRLRPGLEAELVGWKERLLITPQSPAAWNWRERTLYRHFGLFPADLRGMMDAAAFVENGLDTEDLPALFDDWQRQQSELREAPADTNYRRWRTLRDHEDYLHSAASPATARDLLRWLCALAVLPTPTWEITLAVAHALGIEAQHDRLLTLARIPWLQDGSLHPRLRRELLAALSDDDERLARTALRDELAAVRPLTADSHAAHELESALAMQEFLLQPEAAEQRNLIALLLDSGALTRIQEDELDLAVERWDARVANPSAADKQDAPPAKRSIRDWLAERVPKEEDAPPPPPKPVFTKDFWKAVITTVIVLVLGFAGIFYNNTTQLQRAYFYKLAYYPESRTAPGVMEGTLQREFFIEEHWKPDSAVIYNNLGVGAGTSFSRESIVAGLPISTSDTVTWQEAIPRSISYFEKALGVRKNYPIANLNAIQTWYNRAALLLDDEQAPRDSFLQAARDFQHVIMLVEAQYLYKRLLSAPQDQSADSVKMLADIRLDALHGQGIALYYADLRDSARVLYEQLQGLKYFDTLQWQPNLATLFAGNAMRVGNNTLTQPTLAITLYDTIPVAYNEKEITIQAGIARIKGNKPLRNLQFKLFIDLNGRQTPLTGFNARYSVARNNYILQLRLPRPSSNDVLHVVLESEGERVRSNPLSLRGFPNLFPEPEMLLVRGGTFRMGSPDDDKDAGDDEKPAHNARLRDFYIGKTEVTNAQYAAFLNDYRSKTVKSGRYAGQEMIEEYEWGIRFPDAKGDGMYRPQTGYENHPVIYVSWYGAVEYCNWLSQKTGRKYRLPTEAEWEYAARGGPQWRDSLTYAGSNTLDEVAWYYRNSNNTTHAVGSKKANQLGAFDMSGNVWEWCGDWYGEDYYRQFRNKTAVEQIGPASGSFRVCRGGSWFYVPQFCRVAVRFSYTPGNRHLDLGFRLARTN